MNIYDITNIPYFAYSPDLRTWLIFLFFCLCFAGGIYLYSRGIRRRTSIRAFDETIMYIENLLESFRNNASTKETSGLKDYLARAGISCRRLVSRFERFDISSASANELNLMKQQAADTSLQELTEQLIKIQDISYRPAVNQEMTQKILIDLRNAIRNYRDNKLTDKK